MFYQLQFYFHNGDYSFFLECLMLLNDIILSKEYKLIFILILRL